MFRRLTKTDRAAAVRGGGAGNAAGGVARHRVLVLAGVAAVAAAACGSPSSSGSSTPSGSAGSSAFDPTNFSPSTVSWLNANINKTGSPPSTPTGDHTIAGSTDVSGMLDPQAEYDTIGYTVLTATTRTLLGYAASPNLTTSSTPTADAASNYTVSSDGLTYTFTLRQGMRWAVTDPTTGQPVTADDGMPVTSQDFALGLERNCLPAIQGYNNISYYTTTIAGFADFCNNLSGMTKATNAQLAAYIQSNPPSGIKTPDASTLVITLSAPAVDFTDIMAMFFAAAAPPASLNYTPLTAGNPIWSDGPYEVAKYTPNTAIKLVPNPYWGSTSGTDTTSTSWSNDPVHNRYVASIDINETLSPAAAADQVQQEIEAGTLDLEWNTVVPDSSLQTLAGHSNPGFGDFPSPGITNPYLVFNLQANTPLQNVAVRQALEYSVDKVALGKIYGGPDFNLPLDQVFTPGSEGYIPGYDPYATPGNAGDPQKCKTLLKAAGYPNGFTITDYYRTDGNHPAVFQEIQKDFQACGVTVNGKGISKGYYTSSGILATSASQLATMGWDITEPGWVPDWYGKTNARSVLPDLFAKGNFPGTNWGDFVDPTLESLITQAETAPTYAQANSYWQQANKEVMTQAPFIPFQTQLTNIMHSASVHNAIYDPFSAQYNITALWLS